MRERELGEGVVERLLALVLTCYVYAYGRDWRIFGHEKKKRVSASEGRTLAPF